MPAFIKYIAYHLPETKLTNEDLSAIFPKLSAAGIYKITGIHERSIAAEDELSSDLAIIAAEKLFREKNLDRSTVDHLIFCTQGPDYFSPTTACVMQNRLNLSTNTGALDINMGCTGFIYSLSMAKGLIETGAAKNVLLLNCSALVNHIHPLDKSSRILFSDAATAVLVSERPENSIGNFVFGTDGAKANIMMLKAGAFRHPFSTTDLSVVEDEFGNFSTPAHFNMKGDEVLNFSMDVVPGLVNNILEKNNMKMEDIDLFIFHQANLYLMKLLKKLIKIPDEKFCINLAYTGNTVSCTIPIALKDQMEKGRIKTGDKVMLVAFGIGASWAGTIITI